MSDLIAETPEAYSWVIREKSQRNKDSIFGNFHAGVIWTEGNELISCKDPIVSLDSHQDGCDVSFLFRGKDIKHHYDAHNALPIAAAQAAILIRSMRSRHAAPLNIVYEFCPQHSRWFPSSATLEDGRLVSNRNILIALEQHPTGLSIGIHKGKGKLPKHRKHR